MTRNRIGVIVVGMAAALLVSACSTSAGDGRLLNSWPVLSEAKIPEPKVGDCATFTATFTSRVEAGGFTPVGCDTSHQAEVVYVGHFTGPDAERATVPPNGSIAHKTAFGECMTAAREYLGDDWKAGQVDLVYTPPKSAHWAAGARYFRCDLVEVKGEGGAVVARSESLKDGLRGARPLATLCVDHKLDGTRITDTLPVSCDQPHDAELAGVFRAADVPFPEDVEARRRAMGTGCSDVLAKYLGITVEAYNRRTDLSWLFWSPTRDEWAAGNRYARCYVVAVKDGTKIRGTVKGLGDRPLPT